MCFLFVCQYTALYIDIRLSTAYLSSLFDKLYAYKIEIRKVHSIFVFLCIQDVNELQLRLFRLFVISV